MYLKQLTFVFFFFLATIGANAEWGKTGHRAVGEIAEDYLTKKAKKKIRKILQGSGLAFVANYADEIKSDKAYSQYGPWHYVNYPFDSSYQKHPKNPQGDIIAAIENCIQLLKNKNTTPNDQAFYLKMLIHLVGDLHQPLHIGIAEDKGGNTFQVLWFKKGTNLHKVWDTHMLDTYRMSYTELAQNKEPWNHKQIDEISEGSIVDWARESRDLCKDIYSKTAKGENLSYRYMYDYMKHVRIQLHKGGIRLATVLNDIYA
ncbi:MAG: S1/P1 nuclease [Flavobacteriaceae bacterium]|nr:S1/P1 nuclease [Flavobacteriaceae bacterium]